MIKFGTDGWRAVIAEDFTFENVTIVSQAIADYLKKIKKKNKRVIIGYDCRFLAKEFAQQISSVLCANNIKVILSDKPVPTPVVSFEVRRRRCNLGVMVTASHNPAIFNGIKIKTKQGGAAGKDLTSEVEKLLGKRKPKTVDFTEYTKKNKKNHIRVEDITAKYILFLQKFVDLKSINKLKLNILIDLMHGSGDNFAKKVLGKSKVNIDYIRSEYNPSFGGVQPEPIEDNLEQLIDKVKKGNYDLGIALDGDADRIAAVNKNGEYIDAQILLPLLAIHMVKNRGRKKGIGKTVVGSNIIDEVSLSLGVPCYETPVGFKYISNLFKEKLISIGGEEAGGIGYVDYIPERDGVASMLMLLEMIAHTGKDFNQLLKELWKKYGRWYYKKTSFPVGKSSKSLNSLKLPQQLLGKKVQRVNKADGIKLITKNSWLMFRESGTEPIVRVYAEAKSRKQSDALIELGKKIIGKWQK
jgi:alpha-D-glucose phosphate-specific phosphoglucomutase